MFKDLAAKLRHQRMTILLEIMEELVIPNFRHGVELTEVKHNKNVEL